MNGFPAWSKAMAHRMLSPESYQTLAQAYGRARKWLNEAAWHYLHPQGHLSRRRLLKLRGRYQGRRCFVIGNGPSLNHTDLAKLKGEVTIGCNGLFLLFDKMGFRPNLYTVEDHLVAEDRAASLNAIRGIPKLFPRDLAYCLGFEPDTIYLNFIRKSDYPGFPCFSDRFDWISYWGGTVTFLNLQLAYYLGCRQVYLVGVDHSYQVPDNLQGTVILSQEDDPNHFDPNYFGPGYRWHDPMVWKMELAYQSARRFFEAHGGALVNATVGGKLEILPRVDFDSLF